MTHFVPSSGGKDSTTLLLRLLEVEPENIVPVITPTGDELPEMEAHWALLEKIADRPLVRIPCPSLMELIEKFGALPNWRQRWCTRLIKIVPFEAWLKNQPKSIVSVGLRADEPDELRSGMEIKDASNIIQRWPLREWGWNITDVLRYLNYRGIKVPPRTDCGCCFFQRIPEWYNLWVQYPDRWKQYEDLEEKIGHTFRSPGRDSWPASLKGMRAEFERGRRPLKRKEKSEHCRVCSL